MVFIKWIQFPAMTLCIMTVVITSLNCCNWLYMPLRSINKIYKVRNEEMTTFYHRSSNNEKYAGQEMDKSNCFQNCYSEHHKGLQTARPGLRMVKDVYMHYPYFKAHYSSPSSHLIPLVNKCKSLLTSVSSVRNKWILVEKWDTSQTIIELYGRELGNTLSALKTSKITHADVGYKGTQLKMTLTLEGNQTIVFKPKRSENWSVFEGEAYSGPDRHQGEISAFHLSLLLNMTMVPLAVGRRVSLKKEIIPVASKQLARTFFIRKRSHCLYGVCHYCRSENAVCDNGVFLDGAAILWLPKHLHLFHFPHPWARTYDRNKLARWETNKDFCKLVNDSLPVEEKNSLLLSLIDAAIFDFLIQNGDRHHYTVISSALQGPLVLMDNGKSFGDPSVDHIDILAPLLQCCRIHKMTLERLELLAGGGLSKALGLLLRNDDLYPILSPDHLKAMDRRLILILASVQVCQRSHGDAIFS